MVCSLNHPSSCMDRNPFTRFLKRLAKEMKLGDGMRSLADLIWVTLRSRLFLHGADWRPVSPKSRISIDMLHYWQFETSKSADFRGLGPEIPLATVFEEVQKVWPIITVG